MTDSTSSQARAEAWRALETRLELEDASERAGKLRAFLDLAPSVRLAPIYRARLNIVPDGRSAALYLFDYRTTRSGPTGEAAQLSSVAMLSAPHLVSDVPVKAMRKQHKVLERLTASGSGSEIVRLGDSAFDDKITIYARDESKVRALLGEHAKGVLMKAFYAREVAPTLLIGEKQLLLSVTAPADEPVPLGVLEHLTTDLLSLYAIFSIRLFA